MMKQRTIEDMRETAQLLRRHLGVICAVFGTFGMPILPEIKKVWDDTAWLEGESDDGSMEVDQG